MRVTHISIVHKPLDTRIFEKQCRDLAAAGYEVHLLVAGPSRDQIDGVRFHSLASDSDRPTPRHELIRLWRAARCAFRLRPSIFHLHDPHLIPLGIALQLSGSRVVYDVHEDYPAKARYHDSRHRVPGGLKAFTWIVLEWLARRRFDGFVSVSPSLAQPFPAGSTVVVHNFPRHGDFAAGAAEFASRPYRERPNRLIFTGYLREIRCFWEIARALELLPDHLDCQMRAFGAFRPPELAARAQKLAAWRRIEVIPWQPFEVVVRELFDAKIGLALLHPMPGHNDPIRSNKLFEFMAAGIPLIASNLPQWREVVCGIGCGLVVDPRDPAAIATAIEHLLSNPEEAEAMGERGRAAIQAELNWEREAPRLLSLYRALEDERPGVQLTAEPQVPVLPNERGVAAAVAERRAVSS